ncbi:YicC family protein [Ancylobacter sp. 6x-1]|uniref:YicC family protein n=1 Tax=Ancylobacter crimeensis TaxID=2579147 RepID=A0ABT0D6F6_9HYPH|nr:YicC/YloC family endoribonuclease [Ancylobacter crimeensis]MCK0195422.1 YicC family protein [Ancylobacter crimeensis]
MALTSMTGFARTHGTSGAWGWAWELKSVNGKSLDLRLRTPVGWDAIEPAVRQSAARQLSRGNVSANLTLSRAGASVQVRVNEALLRALVETVSRVSVDLDIEPASMDSLLAMKGVIDITEAEDTEEDRRRLEQAVLAGFDQAVADLAAMRRQEGAALALVLAERLDGIARLTAAAEASPVRQPEAIRARLAEQIRTLMDVGASFDSDRLHQEALLIASRVDIREELDRLVTHVAAARAMIVEGGAVGRRLDFLAQEFNRETNTLCSKANDVSLTAIGLELKSVVEQFREQVQNIE